MMHRRSTFPTLIALLALATACSKGAENGTPADSNTVAQAPTAPEVRNPHVMGFEFGHALDTAGAVFGGIANTFGVSDTVFVGVTTVYVPAGGRIEARFLEGSRVAAVDSGRTAAPDSARVARVGLRLTSPASGWKKGPQQIEIFLDGVSQGAKPITIN